MSDQRPGLLGIVSAGEFGHVHQRRKEMAQAKPFMKVATYLQVKHGSKELYYSGEIS